MSQNPIRSGVLALAVCLASVCLGNAANAEPDKSDQIVGVQKNIQTLSIYANPYDAKAQSKIAVKDVPFPLRVLQMDGDFVKVKVADKEMWLDGAEVAVEKPVAYACVKETRPSSRTASIQGASTGCK